MNKYRNKQRRISPSEMFLLILSTVILMAAGVTHAWLKNTQVEVIHNMDKTQRRISDHKNFMSSLQVKIDKKLNIYQLRDDLEFSNSRLVVIPVSSLAIIPSHYPGRVERSWGNSITIAQKQP